MSPARPHSLALAVRPLALVVDDDPAIRTLVARALARVGFDVKTSADGLAALSQVRSHDFDLVVSDVRMPVMSGLELLEQLSLAQPTLPVILMSGTLEESERRWATARGAFEVLEKPFSVNHLQGCAQRAVSRRAVATGSAAVAHVQS
jgi:CheY-like chemotaxis protein